MPQTEKRGNSAYATGGGGVILEHEYAASALASLLLAQPIEGLGDEFIPTSVAMQQAAYSAVDDVAIDGKSPGGTRSLRVACRRRPTIGKSDDSTVKLFGDFIQAVTSDATSLISGRARLGLAVSAPYGPASQIAVLAEVARRQSDPSTFEEAINAEGAYSSNVRERLIKVWELVEEAAISIRKPLGSDARLKELTWQLLQSLFIIELQFEGDVAPGRTSLVSRLTTLTGDVSKAEELRLRLVTIAAGSAIRAGVFTRLMLRRDLRSLGILGEAPDFVHARPQIELLESELRTRTPGSVIVPATGQKLSIDRTVLVQQLVEFVLPAPESRVIIVRGEPDVGKSVIAVRAVDSIRASGGVALLASVRDLPPMAVDLRSALGMSLGDLIAASASAPRSVLVFDGVEVIQESESQSLCPLIRAATDAGKSVILVVRDDALDSLRNLIRNAGMEPPIEFTVPPLAADEIATLAKEISELARVTSDPRAAWLLRRIGLVDLLLSAVQRGLPMPMSLSSEAEIFSIVWSSLIRRGETTMGGVSPDDRETAAIEIARGLLTGISEPIVSGGALPSLRSDGVLSSRSISAVWEMGDRFASDVLRDFATARLLLRGGIRILADAGAPRWAIRATRLLAQAKFAEAIVSSAGSVSKRWEWLRAEFAELSGRHGQRWMELPWEALLTAGWADRLIAELTQTLLGEPGQQSELLRTVMLRFSEDGASDVTVAAPVISWLLDNRAISQDWKSRDADSVRTQVVRWLRGVARLEAEGQDISTFRRLRQRVRDALVMAEINHRDGEVLESLGLLGQDSSDASNKILTTIGDDRPGFLAPLVESVDVARLMAQQNPELLAELAEEYYIEKPRENPSWRFSYEEGIRGHEAPGGMPLAAWYRGPFFLLLRQDFARGLRLIDRMLDRGARDGLHNLSDLTRQIGAEEGESFRGLQLDFAGRGPRTFIGDARVWSWYRGSSVGPRPCMSALFALEMYMDRAVSMGLDLNSVCTIVMRDASTLASVGLCWGFLVRHIEKVSTELDGLLAEPAVWELEFSRVSSEGSLHVQGPDDPTLAGLERRSWSPLNVALYLVISAIQRGDHQRLTELQNIGHRLIENAGGRNAPPTIIRWAAHLDAKRYSVTEQDGQILIRAEIPDEVTSALAPVTEEIEQRQEMYRLLNRYRLKHATPYRLAIADFQFDEEFEKDVISARQLERFFQRDASEPLPGALAGVAAAVLHSAAKPRIRTISNESYVWARDLLVKYATASRTDSLDHPDMMYSDGADRKAALALPLALLRRSAEPGGPGGERDSDAKQVVALAMRACACNPLVEVRQNLAEGIRQIIDEPCTFCDDRPCWHEMMWDAIEAGARRVALGDYSETGRADIQPIVGDLAAELSKVQDRKLMLTYIEPAAICTLDVTRSGTCIHSKAERFRKPLINAYVRSACLWAEEGYGFQKEQRGAFASAVLKWGAAGDAEYIVEIATKLSDSPGALCDYLDGLLMACSYEKAFVPTMSDIWPKMMEIGFGAVRRPRKTEQRYLAKGRIDSLMPHPRTSAYFEDPTPILNDARAHWFPMSSVSQHVEEWLRLAHADMHSVDALVGFLETRPVHEQLWPGLDWVRRLVVDEHEAVTSGFLLVGWLRRLRASAMEGPVKQCYREIVDALALGNYRGARELQALDE